MTRSLLSDENWWQRLRQDDSERIWAIKEIYQSDKLREVVREIIVKAGGRESEIEEVYEQCVIDLDFKVRRCVAFDQTLTDFMVQSSKAIWSGRVSQDESLQRRIATQLIENTTLIRQIKVMVNRYNRMAVEPGDFIQEGIVKLLQKLKSGQYQGGAIAGYFYQMCHNEWRNFTKKSTERSTEETDADFSEPAHSMDPYQMLVRKERSDFIKQCFEQLTERCREILRLKYFVMDQFTMAEIAAKMNLQGAHIASNTLSKCRNKLRDLLNEPSEDHG